MKRVAHPSPRGSLCSRSFSVAGRLLALSLLALPALPACSDDQANAAARGTTDGRALAARMVSDYCNQEAACGAIPPKDEAACVARLKPGAVAEYDNAACNERVSEIEVGRCLQAIQNGDCGNPLDSLSQLDACRARRVCPRR
jgi:uncharacterized protein DUF6184